jgi:hypothetical protein
MKKLALLFSTAALLAVPAAPAPAADIPEINCGIVSCTYVIEQRVDGVKECVEGAVRGVQYILQGTPQPQECSLG